MSKAELVSLRRSTQLALLDEGTKRLVSGTCGLSQTNIKIKAYVTGDVTEEDIERIQSVGAEVIADFPEGYIIEEFCLSLDKHDKEMLDFWAFRRASKSH